MRVKSMLLGTCVIGFTTIQAWAQSPESKPPNPAPKTAEQVYKNIQVLKGIPADQLPPAMQFVAASLGVQCDFCHVERAFEKDDMENKQTARKMMRMMFAINKDNFDGHQEVTCYACHRGAHKPVITPIISEEENVHATAPSVASLPNADQVLEKYLQAVGGSAALAKISNRIQKGTLTVGSEHFPIEILAKAPAKRLSTVHFAGGDSITGVNGDEGWLSPPGRPVHDMSPSELDSAVVEAEAFFPGSLKQMFKQLSVESKEQIGGRETYVVLGTRDNRLPVQFYFDAQSGFLLRMLRYTETPLGRNPTQTDFADYREQDGVKVPFRWIIARPSGRFTIQIEQMQQNVPLDDKRFTKPPAVPTG